MVLPSPTITPKVRAVGPDVQQSFDTKWSPFGPWADKLLIHVYSDFTAMFNAFSSGQVDITDWECNPNDCGSNTDYFVTTPEGELGIFHLNINQHGNFLGIAQQATHTVVAANVKNVVLSATTCGVGFARLVVNLHNQETFKVTGTKPLIRDPLNSLTLASTSGTFTVSDSGGATPNGQYLVPSATGCIPQNGAYTLSTSVYGGSATIAIASQNTFTVDFNVNWNSQSTKQPTNAGVQINRGIDHLLDTTRFVNDASLQGQAANPHFWSPPAQGFNNVCDNPVGGASALSKICQADLNADCTPTPDVALGIQGFATNAHPWVVSCAPIAPYDLTPGPGGPSNYWWAANGATQGVTDGYPSVQNLRAACDHFVLAGISLVGGTCLDVANALTGTVAPTATYAHLSNNGQQIIEYPRTHPPRGHFGTIIADAINAMFGTPNNGGVSGPGFQAGGTCTVNYGFNSPAPGCTPKYYTITQIFDIVFSTNLGAGADDWKLYTGGNTLGSLGDDTFFEFNTASSASICAGPLSTYSNDYTMICEPGMDTWTRAGEFAGNLGLAGQFFRRGFLQGYANGFILPVFAAIRQFVELNSWNWQPGSQSSLNQVIGSGTQVGFQSLLNMRCNPNFTPASASNACGGGDPELIRRGFSQDVHKLSWYTFQTVWDAETLAQIYDSMLAGNPRTGGPSLQLYDWQTTSHSATFDQNEISCTAPSQGVVCLPGTTTQVWKLRSGLKWQDGFPLTADDVCFTIQSYRDVPSSNLVPNVAAVTEDNPAATIHQSGCKVNSATTLTVKLQGQSPFFEAEIGGLPLNPKHLWASVCGTFPFPQPNPCANPAFDAMASGLVVGNGPWQCNNINTGAIGGSCTQNADGSIGTQDVVLDGRIALSRYANYHHGAPNLQSSAYDVLSWADGNNDGAVDILDIAAAALQFGKEDWYWNHSLFGTDDTKVDIGEIATIAAHFGEGITKPFTPAQLIANSMDPAIDPFDGSKGDNYDLACTGAGGSAAANSILVGASNLCSSLPGARTEYEGFTKLAGVQTGNYRILNPGTGAISISPFSASVVNEAGTSAGTTTVSVHSDGTVVIGSTTYTVWDIVIVFTPSPPLTGPTHLDIILKWNANVLLHLEATLSP